MTNDLGALGLIVGAFSSMSLLLMGVTRIEVWIEEPPPPPTLRERTPDRVAHDLRPSAPSIPIAAIRTTAELAGTLSMGELAESGLEARL